MKSKWFVVALLLGGLSGANTASAQDAAPTPVPDHSADGTVVMEGEMVVEDYGPGAYPGPVHALRNAAHDRYHPAPLYAHGRRGYEAAWTNQWNQQQAMARPWHGPYYNARFGAPVALVVPPTAATISNYSWGVGNTTTRPIYHQFGRFYPGAATGGQPGMFQPTPYWPSNTNQFGIYPVRGPW